MLELTVHTGVHRSAHGGANALPPRPFVLRVVVYIDAARQVQNLLHLGGPALLWYHSFMAKKTVQPQKGKRGPPASGKGTPIHVRLQPCLLDDLDRWIAAQDDPKPTRPQAIRVILDAAIVRPRAAKGGASGTQKSRAKPDRLLLGNEPPSFR